QFLFLMYNQSVYFQISFDVVDRDQTHKLRKEIGMDANPWRIYSRIITSYHYLKQSDILEQFRSTCKPTTNSPHLPWDLLIVDEAHNLAPASFGTDSDLSKMLARISPYFEHKLFLTATPHNGHTRSFTGLLELLDPVRFTKKGEMDEKEKTTVREVVIRRLKSEINKNIKPSPFCDRKLQALKLNLDPKEYALSKAFQDFRMKLWRQIAGSGRSEELAGAFAIEVLGKRLLSCPLTFGDSWFRYISGMKEEEKVDVTEVTAAEKAVREETGDDLETESRIQHASKTVGAWLRPFKDTLADEVEIINDKLKKLGIVQGDKPVTETNPGFDSRFNALVDWINSHLKDKNGKWLEDERLVIFTEYKTTLDYLTRRLIDRYGDNGEILNLYGGMDDTERELIKFSFNDPNNIVRILVATDAASEGLNLQETARYLLHYDIPWNPARLEQRNGRLDRHGQARDVHVYHFEATDDLDISFLAYVLGKVNSIREDLGSMGEVFETTFQRRFIKEDQDEIIRKDLDESIERAKGRAEIPRDSSLKTTDSLGEEAAQKLQALKNELDLDPSSLMETLEVALSINSDLPRFEKSDERGKVRFKHPLPKDWETCLDEYLRIGSGIGALPQLVFDSEYFLIEKHGKKVFRSLKDTTLMHLGHPVMQRALATFARTRFPGDFASSSATRWIVRTGEVPDGADALLLLTIEELAVNRLRESFHQWVRTIQLPVKGNKIGNSLPHIPAINLRTQKGRISKDDLDKARDIWVDIEDDVKKYLKKYSEELTKKIRDTLVPQRVEEVDKEEKVYNKRRNEIQQLKGTQSIQKLEKEIAKLKADARQLRMFEREEEYKKYDNIRDKEEELKRRTSHYDDLLEYIKNDYERLVKDILPKRYELQYEAQVFPVTVEIRLPGGES
ncbi:MAG: helicase-related protein, partial [bacterium]